MQLIFPKKQNILSIRTVAAVIRNIIKLIFTSINHSVDFELYLFNTKMSEQVRCPTTGFVVKKVKQSIVDESKKDFVDHLQNAKGKDLFSRYYPAEKYIRNAEQSEIWLQKRSLLSAPSSQILIKDANEQQFYGLNFASNNYLGLANHSSIIEAGIDAAREFGVNSAGSPLAFGATKYYGQLREELNEFLGTSSILFSSGWLAQYGVLKSLLKQYDHILIDQYASPAFYDGAFWTTSNVTKIRHLDEKHLEQKLKQIRSKDKENGIIFVTEGLFSVDSTSPNLINIQALTKKYQAFLIINTGHDLGTFGKTGKGLWEEQNLKDISNVILIGSGSKSVGVNFGFCSLKDPQTLAFIKYFCSTYMFTNAINPIQSNCGLAALRIVRSYEGQQLRTKVLENGKYLREKLQSKNIKVLGQVSPIVCVRIGNETQARIVAKILMDNDIHVNVVQYPSVKVGEANIRMSLSSNHTVEQLNKLVSALEFSLKKGKEIFDAHANKPSKTTQARL